MLSGGCENINIQSVQNASPEYTNRPPSHVYPRRLPVHIFILFWFSPNLVEFGNPSKIQWAPKWDPKSIKWRYNGNLPSKMVLPKRVPENAMICCCIWFSFWFTFGTLSVPNDSLCHDLWYNFQCVCTFLAPTFELNIAKPGPIWSFY